MANSHGKIKYTAKTSCTNIKMRRSHKSAGEATRIGGPPAARMARDIPGTENILDRNGFAKRYARKRSRFRRHYEVHDQCDLQRQAREGLERPSARRDGWETPYTTSTRLPLDDGL